MFEFNEMALVSQVEYIPNNMESILGCLGPCSIKESFTYYLRKTPPLQSALDNGYPPLLTSALNKETKNVIFNIQNQII